MPTVEVVETGAGAAGREAPVRLSALEKAVAACLPLFTFSGDDSVRAWSFTFRVSQMTARVVLDASKGTATFTVTDDLAGKVIGKWTTEVRISGDKWRHRVRQAVGVTLALAYHRPWCSKCRGPVVVRERGADSAQFFGCQKFPSCVGTLGIVPHDIERS
jgi:hypothetical protein